MAAAITTEQLTKSYDERPSVFDLDLEVPEGKIFGFLGSNGAGRAVGRTPGPGGGVTAAATAVFQRKDISR